MSAMKDITNRSPSTRCPRRSNSSDDDIFVDFSTPVSRSLRSTRRRNTSPPGLGLRGQNFASNSERIVEEDGRTSRLSFTPELISMPSVLLTPTTASEEGKRSRFSSFSLESCRPRKKLRLDVTETSENTLQDTLQNLSKQQLVELISGFISERHPELSQEFENILPEPDLREMEERLRVLKRNIFKAFPRRTRSVCSSRDAFSFRRVNSQILAFKKECIDQGKSLLSSKLWKAVVEYVFMACSYVDDLPVWESPAHNCSKNNSFKMLALQCKTALTKGEFTLEELNEYQQRLDVICSSNEHFCPCLKQVKSLIASHQFS
ncbi:predicted protein [Nematostella vectensis]|uniref:Tethering factor for nuclear proteasome STS1 n=1 Tax=Nematostella vectensis TaxID=45351 RepID=A7RTC2_NEMVE|nr:predicted protein [Nematostella vectensis]|eukprot:XP_001637307.1 predicted protein [Nematostella vectensis]